MALTVRKLSLLLGLILAAPLCAHGQLLDNKLQVFGGYSYMRFSNPPAANFYGWEASGEYKYYRWLGIVGDFSGNYGTWNGVHSSVQTYMFGPEFSWPSRISPFLHLLAGAGHFKAGAASTTAIATDIGGGVDIRLVHGVSWRAVEADRVLTHFFGPSQSNTRLSTGIVIRF